VAQAMLQVQTTVALKITAVIVVFLMAQANITHAAKVVGEPYLHKIFL